MQTVPDQFLESHQLSGIILEYRKECGSSDIVQSLCEPEEDEILPTGFDKNNEDLYLLKRFSSGIIGGNGFLRSLDKIPKRYTHLLLVKGETQNEEIVRGKTIWEKKMSKMPFHT